jgi:hypothetical protein
MNIHQAIYTLVITLNRKIDQMYLNIATLAADVEAQKTVVESAVTLLTGLSLALRDALAKLDAAIASGDPVAAAAAQAALDAIAADVEANTSKLSGAVVANTVAAPVLGA